MSGTAGRFPSLNGAATDHRPVLFIANDFTDAKQGEGKNQCDSQPLPFAHYSEHLQAYTEYFLPSYVWQLLISNWPLFNV
jgi:hypothetical protein